MTIDVIEMNGGVLKFESFSIQREYFIWIGLLIGQLIQPHVVVNAAVHHTGREKIFHLNFKERLKQKIVEVKKSNDGVLGFCT